MLNLDELEAGGEARSAVGFKRSAPSRHRAQDYRSSWRRLKTFQKRLFEKKKFVTEVNYCVTLDRVPEELYPEIAKNKAQIEEWKRLFHIHEIEHDTTRRAFKEPVRVDFLKANPSLVLDTLYFPRDFIDRLLGSEAFHGEARTIETALNGILVHGENLQALDLLEESFRENVACTYIDPPYNTGNDEFCYKDNYQHSSWLAMMSSRLARAFRFLKPGGAQFTSIDDHEYACTWNSCRPRYSLDGQRQR